MVNERLRGAILTSGLTVEQISERLGVSARTVERWVEAKDQRKPYRRFQYALANLLQRDLSDLWSDEESVGQTAEAGRAELVKLYPHRAVVPKELWTSLYAGATRSFDLVVYAGFWLSEDPTFFRLIREKASAGVPVRMMLGDPDSPAIAQRGEDEGIGPAMAGKIRNALANYAPLFSVPGVEFRLHATTLYNSLYRADDDMLVNGHVYGVGAYLAPVLHLSQVPGGELFSTYAASIERIWESSRRITAPMLEGEAA
ncbi:helix-turn-helix domain-containing protein [Kitasatospora sp. MBT63]|uniref:helix-turn-helix domain-containing protein n=1 Tax=Kitasatospora sp. MBT63 TaxID=1444768 RepID=UPI0005396343|nr:helix-turn-helix transcriptional regulator [Kitasatospora sp. MBT63]